jgi:hypothetical protein
MQMTEFYVLRCTKKKIDIPFIARKSRNHIVLSGFSGGKVAVSGTIRICLLTEVLSTLCCSFTGQLQTHTPGNKVPNFAGGKVNNLDTITAEARKYKVVYEAHTNYWVRILSKVPPSGRPWNRTGV